MEFEIVVQRFSPHVTKGISLLINKNSLSKELRQESYVVSTEKITDVDDLRNANDSKISQTPSVYSSIRHAK